VAHRLVVGVHVGTGAQIVQVQAVVIGQPGQYRFAGDLVLVCR